MSRRKQCMNDAHFEAEKGYRLSKAEYRVLKLLLPELGFAFEKKSQITDFVAPSQGETTRRLRVENVQRCADGNTGLHFIKCFKSHPITGKAGRNVRMESEQCVSPRTGRKFVLDVMQRLGAPIPYYTKKRWHYQGTWCGLELTITLDRAYGLGKYSGHYMEIETLLPADSTTGDVKRALRVIAKLADHLVEKRRAKISYRKMLMRTWAGGGDNLRKVSKRKLRKAKVRYRKLLAGL